MIVRIDKEICAVIPRTPDGTPLRRRCLPDEKSKQAYDVFANGCICVRRMNSGEREFADTDAVNINTTDDLRRFQTTIPHI